MSYKKREKAKKTFMGALITPMNRKVYFQQYFEDYLKKVENAGNPDKLNPIELSTLASGYANMEIKREEKHLKAFLKGSRYYKCYGQTYPVLTPQLFEQKAHMDSNINGNFEKKSAEIVNEIDDTLSKLIESLPNKYSPEIIREVGLILSQYKEEEE